MVWWPTGGPSGVGKRVCGGCWKFERLHWKRKKKVEVVVESYRGWLQ